MSLVGAGISGLGGLIGELFSGPQRAEAERLMRQAMDTEGNVDMPQFEKLIAQKLGPSALEKIRTDPRLEQAQYSAMDKLQGIENAGGLTLADRANMNKLMGQAARQNSAGRAQIQAEMDARGTGNSGAALAMQLQRQSDAGDRAAQIGMDTAGKAQARYFDSVMARGEMGGKMRSQEYSEKARAAEANDLINRWNASQQTNAFQYNQGQQQLDYQNRQGKASRKAAALRAQAGQTSANADRTGKMIGGVAAGVGNGFAGYGAGGTAGGYTPPPLVDAYVGDPDEWDDPYRK